MAFVRIIDVDCDAHEVRAVIKGEQNDKVFLEVCEDSLFNGEIFRSERVAVDNSRNHIAKVSVRGLAADTTYFHRVDVGGTTTDTGEATTMPADESLQIVHGVAGSCTLDSTSGIWSEIDTDGPLLLAHLGDRFYFPGPSEPAALQAYLDEYDAFHDNDYNTHITKKRAAKSIPDDHEHALNGFHLGTTNRQQLRDWAMEAYKLYTAHSKLVNPDAVFRSDRVGGVEVFMLDSRFANLDVSDYERWPSDGADTHEIDDVSTRSVIRITDGGLGHVASGTDDAYRGWYVRCSRDAHARTLVRPAGSDHWRRIKSSYKSGSETFLVLEEPFEPGFDAEVHPRLIMENASILDGGTDPMRDDSQWCWLVRALRASTAPVKWMMSPLSMHLDQSHGDNWRGLSALCGEIRTLSQMTGGVSGIFVTSGDSHRHGLEAGPYAEWLEINTSPFDQAASTGAPAEWSHGQADRPSTATDGTAGGFAGLVIDPAQLKVKVDFFWADGTPMGGLKGSVFYLWQHGATGRA